MNILNKSILNMTFKASLLSAALMSATGALADGMPETTPVTQAQSGQGSASSQSIGGEQSGTAATSTTSDQSDTSGQSSTGQSASAKQDGMAEAQPTVVMIIPIETANKDSAMKEGCWARVYENQGLKGNYLTLLGPTSISDMQGPFSLNWDDRIKSVETGKKARVMVYDNQNFQDLVASFKPGQKVTDVSKRMGFFDNFGSLRIVC